MLAIKMAVEVLGSLEKQSGFIQMLLPLILSIFKHISPYQRKGCVSIVRNNTHYIVLWYVTTVAIQSVVKEATFFIDLQINVFNWAEMYYAKQNNHTVYCNNKLFSFSR